MSALHQKMCHWDHNPNLWILIPVTHLDCVSSVFPLDYGSHAILWIVFLVSTLDSVYISTVDCRPTPLTCGPRTQDEEGHAHNDLLRLSIDANLYQYRGPSYFSMFNHNYYSTYLAQVLKKM